MGDPFVVLEGTSLEDRTRGEVLSLREEADHHLRRVRRLDDGDELELADGAGRMAAARLCERGVELAAPPDYASPRRPRVRVLQGLPKGRKIEEVVRTLTELGAARITPVACARSVRRLRHDEDKHARRHERWQSIARSACEQARRAHRPTVDRVLGLGAALEDADGPVLAADVGASRSLRKELRALDEPAALTLAVGPEGGWSPDERAVLRAAGGRLVGVGRTVLRTEHAATVLVAAVAYEHGWYG